MKLRLIIPFTAVLLIITAHRSPAPISEGLETPTPAPASTPTPKPAAPRESTEPKTKTTKPKPRHADNEAPAKHATPEPTQAPSAEEKPKEKKPKAKQAESEAAPKHAAAETTKLSVTGTWRGHWDNSRGDQGTTFLVFNEGPNGVITGETEALPFSARPPLQNGHRSGNTITFMFRRGNRDYHVTGTVSSDGTTLSGKYQVTQDKKVIYTGTYSDFKRK